MADLSVYEELTVTEDIEPLIDVLNLSVYEDVSVVEYVSMHDIIVELSVYDEVAVTEYISMHDIIIDLSVGDDVSVVEDVSSQMESGIDVGEDISIAEWTQMHDIIIELEVYEEITIEEWGFADDYYMVTMNVYEYVTVGEARAARIDATFNEFLRGYPFVEETIASVLVMEFENGVEQRRDKWGRTKKRFEVNFPVMSKAEIEAIRDYFIDRHGSADSFYFTNPVDGITYRVRYQEESFRLERLYYGTYSASVNLIEVF